MSSVVNKSGTRFAPKVKPRSVPAAANTAKPTPPLPSAIKPTNDEETAVAGENDDEDNEEEEDDDDEDEEDDDDSRESSPDKDALPDNESTQVSSSLSKTSAPLQTSTQLSVPSSEGLKSRSSRLDSLSNTSGSRPLFKPNFEEHNSNEGRLSSISNQAPKKVRANPMPEKDAALQALKRRRMSVRSASTRKPGTAQKIGIVSKIETPDSNMHTAAMVSDLEQKRESSAELFQRTDSLYEKYTIRSLKEIPGKIQDDDSDRYMIDEHEFTMAELCKPKLPIGTISENFERAKLASKIKFKKRQDRRKLRKQAREEFKSLKSLNRETEEKELAERKEASEALLSADVPEYTQAQSAPKLKLSQDGFVLDEESTVVDRHRNATFENSQKKVVDENPFENLYNSSTYGRNAYTDPWTSEELVKFYKSLSMWGTDFNLIAQLFPYRTRKQIKAKFINEERKHPVIVELALRSRLPADFDQYCLDTKKEIGTVNEFNEKLEQIKLKHEEEMKEIEAARASAKEEDAKNVRNLAVVGKKSSGGFRTDELKAYRKTEVVLGTIEDVKKKKDEDVAELA